MLASSSIVVAAARSIVAAFLFAAFVLCTSTGCIAQVAQQAKQVAKAKESPEQKAVREYLRENTPTGKFEEIKWWPVKSGKAIAPDWTGTVIRVKYRTDLGGMSVMDDVFTISTQGKLRLHRDDPINANRDRIFSDKK